MSDQTCGMPEECICGRCHFEEHAPRFQGTDEDEFISPDSEVVYSQDDGEKMAAQIATLQAENDRLKEGGLLPFSHEACDAFWEYWKTNGETGKHGYYESTWGAIRAYLEKGRATKYQGDIEPQDNS